MLGPHSEGKRTSSNQGGSSGVRVGQAVQVEYGGQWYAAAVRSLTLAEVEVYYSEEGSVEKLPLAGWLARGFSDDGAGAGAEEGADGHGQRTFDEQFGASAPLRPFTIGQPVECEYADVWYSCSVYVLPVRCALCAVLWRARSHCRSASVAWPARADAS